MGRVKKFIDILTIQATLPLESWEAVAQSSP